MDWISGIQRAIDYIEAHLTDELDYDTIARESFSSAFHSVCSASSAAIRWGNISAAAG